MVNVYDRIRQFREMVREVPAQGSRSCINSNQKLGSNIRILKRLGGASVYGEAYQGEMTNEKGQIIKIAIKKIPLSAGAIYHMSNQQVPRPAHVITSAIWAELACLHLTTELVLQKAVPNLPCMYTYTICDHCQYSNPKVIDRLQNDPAYQDTNACILAVSELATAGDFETWCTSKAHTVTEWYVAYFQIFSALYCLQFYFGIIHHDLHWGNIIVSKEPNIPPNSYLHYRIANQDYYIPDHGWRFIIWDYGMASIKDKINITKFQGIYQERKHNLYPESYDAQQISRAPFWMLQLKAEGHKSIPKCPKELFEFADTCTFFFKNRIGIEHQIWHNWKDYFGSLPKKATIRESYHIGRPLKSLDPAYRWFLNHPSQLNTDYSRYETGAFIDAGSDALVKDTSIVDKALHFMKFHGSKSVKEAGIMGRREE